MQELCLAAINLEPKHTFWLIYSHGNLHKARIQNSSLKKHSYQVEKQQQPKKNKQTKNTTQTGIKMINSQQLSMQCKYVSTILSSLRLSAV